MEQDGEAMKASYSGKVPGFIDLYVDGEKITVTMESARELYATLEDALREAEDGMPTLLPCPFCGSQAKLAAMSLIPRIWCTECSAEMRADTWEELVRMWNRRTDDAIQ